MKWGEKKTFQHKMRLLFHHIVELAYLRGFLFSNPSHFLKYSFSLCGEENEQHYYS